MTCQQTYVRGYRAGRVCGKHATMIVVLDGTLTCGTHARAWLPKGLARIAYWRPREQAWL